jgi:hypothetical protein
VWGRVVICPRLQEEKLREGIGRSKVQTRDAQEGQKMKRLKKGAVGGQNEKQNL